MHNDLVDWMRLGNKITRMRVDRNMTQFQLAECTGLSEVYIGYIEQGKRRAALDTYIKIVNALGYTLDDLMSEYLTNRDAFAADLLNGGVSMLIFFFVNKIIFPAGGEKENR